MGFVMVGLFAFDKDAVRGAMLQMLNHGVSTGALFLLVGAIYERRHKRGLDDFGGLARVAPGLALALIVTTMSSIGLPGTNGFVGEFMIIAGTFKTQPLFAVLTALGVLLGAIYMLQMVRRVLLRQAEVRRGEAPDGHHADRETRVRPAADPDVLDRPQTGLPARQDRAGRGRRPARPRNHSMTPNDLALVGPILLPASWRCWSSSSRCPAASVRAGSFLLAVLGAAVSLGYTIHALMHDREGLAFFGTMKIDRMALLITLFVHAAALLSLLLSKVYLDRRSDE